MFNLTQTIFKCKESATYIKPIVPGLFSLLNTFPDL